MKLAKPLFLVSWVLLLVVCAVVLLGAFSSLGVAYFQNEDNLTQTVTLEKIKEAGGEEAVKAFKGRRATAATWAIGCMLLAAWVVVVPYRRGRRWAWWALLIAVGGSQLLSLVRVAVLGSPLGSTVGGTVLALLLLGLLAGAPQTFAQKVEE